MRVLVNRFAYSYHGVFSHLLVNDFRCFTLENPWADNQPNVSCIPAGIYTMRLGMYNKPKVPYAAYELQAVPGRSLIKIHVGNTMDDVLGCLVTGRRLGWVKKPGKPARWAVTSSKLAFNAFMKAMGGVETAVIEIADCSIRTKVQHA